MTFITIARFPVALRESGRAARENAARWLGTARSKCYRMLGAVDFSAYQKISPPESLQWQVSASIAF